VQPIVLTLTLTAPDFSHEISTESIFASSMAARSAPYEPNTVTHGSVVAGVIV
jgi:hypothetical protein